MLSIKCRTRFGDACTDQMADLLNLVFLL